MTYYVKKRRKTTDAQNQSRFEFFKIIDFNHFKKMEGKTLQIEIMLVMLFYLP